MSSAVASLAAGSARASARLWEATLIRTFTTDDRALLYLLQVASAAFPTGSFAHSFGFETLVADGEIDDADSLEEHAHLWLRYGVAPLDGAAVALAHASSSAGDVGALATLDSTLSAIKLPRETHEASLKTGNAFLRSAQAAFAGGGLARYEAAVRDGRCEGHAATAFGVAAADARVDATTAVVTYLQTSFANLVGVVGRLVPLGQNDVQRITAHAHDRVISCADLAITFGQADLASCTPFLDLASMRHQHLYSRLCIS